MNAQNSENDLLAGFRSQVKWLPTNEDINPFKRYRPLRPFVMWYNTRRMNRWLSKELDSRLSSRHEVSEAAKLKRSKPVIDLALDAYLAERGDNPTSGMDATFKDFAISQIKLFIFAGHDTTSSTLCYVYYLLHSHPAAAANLTDELNAVFGTDLAQTPALIAANPHLLNKLPYTTAIIRETLRLFPPASTLRKGQPGFSLTVPHAPSSLPTYPFTVWVIHQAMHRSAELWPQPDTFLPERWLVPEGDPLYPVKGAWRPFEFGPRNCIGQEVAMLESKIIIACTVRSFEVRPAYEELDRARGEVRRTLMGERAYQILLGSAKPSDGMPARVRVR
jgi:cytochrome P450